jgi:hypothetical protein
MKLKDQMFGTPEDSLAHCDEPARHNLKTYLVMIVLGGLLITAKAYGMI